MADRRDRLRAVLASRDHADLTSFTAEDLTELPLDNYHNTALAYAIEHRAHGDTIRHLVIVRGCSLESVNRNMWRPLCSAMVAAQPDTVRLLLQLGADPLAQTEPGLWTCVHRAAKVGRGDNLRALFEAITPDLAKGLANTPAARELRPLYVSAKHNHLDASRALVEAGGDPSLLSRRGNNALHYLALEERAFADKAEHWAFLAQHGADESAVSRRQLTPWEKQYQRDCDALVREVLAANVLQTIEVGANDFQATTCILHFIEKYNGRDAQVKALAQHVRHPLKFNDEVHKQRYGDLEVIHYVVLHVVRRIRDKTLATVFEDEDLQTGQREA
jgi:ankyrin repeat protein